MRIPILIQILVSCPVWAQNISLPKPAAVIYKCTVGRKVVYTDDPCEDAARVDVTPTRGASKISGKERISLAERSTRFREAMADAIKPLTGTTREGFALEVRRQGLSPSAKSSCRALDIGIPELEQLQARSAGGDRVQLSSRLFADRKRFRDLGC